MSQPVTRNLMSRLGRGFGWLLGAAAGLSVVFSGRILSGPESAARSAGFGSLLVGVFFFGLSFVKDAGYWRPLRSRLAGLGCLVWGLYLFLYSGLHALWMLDLVLFVLALLFLLGRSRPVFLLACSGILAVVGVRHFRIPSVVALLDLVLLSAAVHCAPVVEDRLARRRQETGGGAEPRDRGAKILKFGVPACLFVFLVVYAARPVHLMVSPEKRRELLLAKAKELAAPGPAALSPLARRLREHVEFMAGHVGERSAYQAQEGVQVRAYVADRFREAGYAPELLEYEAVRRQDFMRSRPYANVEAVLGPRDGKDVWVVGAHYDTAPGTPGADDNASAVAVLLELSRLMRDRSAGRGIRFVAFDTEEPPFFASRDMGSYRYARGLRAEGARVRGVLVLEMLGYFNPLPGSQIHPPFLALFYPKTGDFVGLASNLSSSGLMRGFLKSWRERSDFPIEGVVLPSIFSTLPISDQLNFWWEGYPAVMLSDSAFFRNPHYHQAADVPATLDYERMAVVTEALAAVLSR